MRIRDKKRRSIATLAIVWLLVLVFIIPVYAQQTASQRETVRAGFFSLDGYHMQDKDGIRSGYGYDLLNMAEHYNNWKFEYVGYEQDWTDMLDMLDKGQIDLVSFAQKTKEREEEYDFSDSPVGTGSVILTVRADDKRYMVGDADSFDGMRIGIVKNSTHRNVMAEYAKKNGITFSTILYEDTEDMKKDLQAGKNIDGMLSSSLRTLNNETVLEELSPENFYIIVKKGNTELLEKVNRAIAQMDMDVPGWRLTLKNQYYSDDNYDQISLDKDKLSYIDQLKNTNTVLKVVSNPDLAPYSYVEDGELKGIAPKIFEEIAKRLGITYEYILTDKYEEYNSFVKSGGADIDLTCFPSYGLAEHHGLIISNPYMTTSLARLTRDSFSGNMDSIAELTAVSNNTTYTDELLDSVDSKFYDSHAECVEAVRKGDVDGTYMYTYSAQKAVAEDVKNRLMYTIMPEYSVGICIGVNMNADYRLIQILDEGIKSVKGTYAQHVISDELAAINGRGSLIAVVYDYPGVALFLLGLLLFVLFIVILFVVKTRGRKKEHQQALELSRFTGYVCEANDVVMEVNLSTDECYVHNIENDILVSKYVPYEYLKLSHYKDIIYPEDIERLKTEENISGFWNNFRKKGTGIYFEARAKDEDGEYRWYSYTIRAIPKDENHPDNFIIFKKNIDKVKRQEMEQRQALEDALESAKGASSAKGQFLSRMSHEIRTPLNAVIGYLNIAKDSHENISKIMHCIENSDIAAKHLLNIINDVLDISSIESGKMKIAHEEFDLKKQITAITALFFSQAKEKNIKFDVQLKDITEEWVVGDGLRVNQILMNLLSNAVKFTPEKGSVLLTVTQLNTDDKKVYMRFEVEDNGIGMTEEYQKRLFRPFEQESAVTAQKYGGTGLGLSIVYNLINMMGGKIDVKSAQGEGTTFTVSLHFDRAENNHDAETKYDYSHVRALVVDDDAGSCEYMKALLKRCKVKSDTVKDGEAAVRQIKRRLGSDYKYDLCIMDWNMPGMNGLEVAKRIREECDPDMPIIIATAYDVTDCEEQAKEVGVDRVIAKPLFQSTMFDLLVSAYGKYEPQESKKLQMENLKGLRVLLAEDNPMNLEIAVDILTKAEIVVDAVTDGKQAYDKFLEEKPETYDVILMDVQMPVMDGYGATKAIRESGHERAKTIPIIAMTANAFAEDVTAALASGMNDHIAKPIDYDKLFSVLHKFYKTV